MAGQWPWPAMADTPFAVDKTPRPHAHRGLGSLGSLGPTVTVKPIISHWPLACPSLGGHQPAREPVDAAEARGLPTSLPLRRTFLCRRQESRHSETKHAFKKIECVYKKHKMPLPVYCFSDTNFISTRRKFQS